MLLLAFQFLLVSVQAQTNGNQIPEPRLDDYYTRPQLAYRKPGILVEPYDIIEGSDQPAPSAIDTDR